MNNCIVNNNNSPTFSTSRIRFLRSISLVLYLRSKHIHFLLVMAAFFFFIYMKLPSAMLIVDKQTKRRKEKKWEILMVERTQVSLTQFLM